MFIIISQDTKNMSNNCHQILNQKYLHNIYILYHLKNG